MWDGPTLGEQFLAHVESRPDGVFTELCSGEEIRKTTFAQALLLVGEIVQQLHDSGLQPGDRIAFYLDSVFDTLYWFLACASIGVVPVPLDPNLSIRYLETVIERAECKAVFALPGSITTGLSVAVLNWRLSAEKPAQAPPSISASQATSLLRSSIPRVSDLFVIQQSSGSTGTPKLILRDHRPMVRSSVLFRLDHDMEPGQQGRRLMVNSLTHGAGIVDLCGLIGSGATACITQRPNLGTTLREVQKLQPDIIGLVPRILKHLYDEFMAGAGDPSQTLLFGARARSVTYGGAAMPPAMKAFLRGQGLEVYEVYGCTECGIMTSPTPSDVRDGWSKIVDDVDIRVAEDGELLVRSSVMMLGYAGEHESEAKYTGDGYYCTGDRGEVRDGWVRVFGRKIDVFGTASGGVLYPKRIEAMVESIAGVEQAALVGNGGPYLVALIVCGKPSDRDEVCARLVLRLSEMNRDLEIEEKVRAFHLLEAPFDPSEYRTVGQGKANIDRNLIAQRYAKEIESLYSLPASDDSLEVRHT